MVERSPLHAVHVDLGASFTRFGGFEMPVRYGSDLAEHHAVRERAGLFDLSHMGELRVRGPEAGAALDQALIGELAALTVGRARYTMLCDEDGGILDDLVGYRLAEDRYLLVANAANTGVVHEALLDRCAPYDVEVLDATAWTALIALQGPQAASLLAPVTGAELTALRSYAATETRVAGVPVLLARTGYTGEDGFELFCEHGDAVALWSALADAGVGAGLQPCGLASRDTLRLEAGMPLYGHELTRERTPYEAGLGRLVKLDKQEFVGRGALADPSRSAPEQTLVGLVGEGRRAPRHGYDVLDDAGRVIGAVTSGALSPTLRVPIAMAYLPRSSSEPGTRCSVDVRGTSVPVQVVPLPFYRRR